jgi:hypothetical protein
VAFNQITVVRNVPKVDSNLSTKNDRFGAVAAVSEIQDDFRFVPELAYPPQRRLGYWKLGVYIFCT